MPYKILNPKLPKYPCTNLSNLNIDSFLFRIIDLVPLSVVHDDDGGDVLGLDERIGDDVPIDSVEEK